MTALKDTLLGSAPTFEKYLQAVRSRSSKSITGLTYALMKHWPEDIHKLMYDLLATVGRKDDGGLVAVSLAGTNPEATRSAIAPSYAADRPTGSD